MTVWRLAHRYAARGVPVFPCLPDGKRPLTRHGLHDASTDRDVIASWARAWPGANLAIVTGHWSGLYVIDVDRKAGGPDGMATLETLEGTLGTLPTTLTSFTPGGGEHRYFRLPVDLILRNTNSKLGPGVDTRGEGGYALVAPSVIDGRAYRWVVRTPPVELPARWIEVLAPRPPVRPAPRAPSGDTEQSRVAAWCQRALQDEARQLAAAAPGTRNHRLWCAAAALGGLVHLGVFDVAQAREALAWACSTWSARSASKDAATLERGLAFGLANPRSIDLGGDRAA